MQRRLLVINFFSYDRRYLLGPSELNLSLQVRRWYVVHTGAGCGRGADYLSTIHDDFFFWFIGRGTFEMRSHQSCSRCRL